MRPKGQLFDLKRFRAVHNLSQKEIAEAVNRPQSFLSAIEHGKRSAPPGFLDNLSRIYHVDNISDYMRKAEEPTYGDVCNVKDAIVNSPGGLILLSEFGSKLTPKEILRILAIEDSQCKEASSPQQASDSSTVSELVKLLTDANARCKKAEDRIRELEAQVKDLQAQLPKRKK